MAKWCLRGGVGGQFPRNLNCKMTTATIFFDRDGHLHRRKMKESTCMGYRFVPKCNHNTGKPCMSSFSAIFEGNTLLRFRNFATMATWSNNFSSLFPFNFKSSSNQINLFLVVIGFGRNSREKKPIAFSIKLIMIIRAGQSYLLASAISWKASLEKKTKENILDSTSKTFPDSGIWIPLHGASNPPYSECVVWFT